MKSSIRIGHIDFKIVEMEKLSASANYGMYVSEDEEIHIRKGMSPRRSAEVLIHEVLHGIVEHYAIPLKADEEERLVATLANGLATVIRDNQEVFTQIVKALK